VPTRLFGCPDMRGAASEGPADRELLFRHELETSGAKEPRTIVRFSVWPDRNALARRAHRYERLSYSSFFLNTLEFLSPPEIRYAMRSLSSSAFSVSNRAEGIWESEDSEISTMSDRLNTIGFAA
jgi:hypothetical protein